MEEARKVAGPCQNPGKLKCTVPLRKRKGSVIILHMPMQHNACLREQTQRAHSARGAHSCACTCMSTTSDLHFNNQRQIQKQPHLFCRTRKLNAEGTRSTRSCGFVGQKEGQTILFSQKKKIMKLSFNIAWRNSDKLYWNTNHRLIQTLSHLVSTISTLWSWSGIRNHGDMHDTSSWQQIKPCR